MSVKFQDYAYTTLDGAISAGAVTFEVVSSSSLPTLGAGDTTFLYIEEDVVEVTAIAGTTCTCTGATVNSDHASGSTVELRMGADLLEKFATDEEVATVVRGENLLFDPNFTINLEDYQQSDLPLVDGEFYRTMWEASGAVTSVSVSGKEIAISPSDALQQRNYKMDGTSGSTCTVSYEIISGAIYFYGMGQSGQGNDGAGTYSHTFTASSGIPFRMLAGSSGCVVKNVKYELGGTATGESPSSRKEEIDKCGYHVSLVDVEILDAIATSTTKFVFTISTKAANANVSMLDTLTVSTLGFGNIEQATGISAYNSNGNARIEVTTSALSGVSVGDHVVITDGNIFFDGRW